MDTRAIGQNRVTFTAEGFSRKCLLNVSKIEHKIL